MNNCAGRKAPLLLTMLLAACPAWADMSQTDMLNLIERLNARVEKLEKSNAELEQRQAGQSSIPQALDERVRSIEEHNARIARGLDSERVSENEPELTSRLKAVEMQASSMNKAARTIDALDGVTAGMSLTTTAQHPSGAQQPNSQLNYRGDIFVTLPMGKIGDIDNKFFAQFRLGQGDGLNTLATYSKPNASAFRVVGALPDSSVAVLGQAWLQTSIPLPFDGFKQRSRETLDINFGKMDPFAFFDQNAIANDETRQFLNTVFVHNPLLDAGSDIGVDANGFSPGLRLSYLNRQSKHENWRLSAGILGSGQGANYTRSFSSPLLIVQAETQQRFLAGLTGNYRFYSWRNGQAAGYAGNMESHAGWGISADQGVGDAITVFGRYGHQTSGHVRFDRALTLGTEIGGNYWSRSGDSLGIAAGHLHTSSNFSHDSATVDANGDGRPDYGFTAGGAEQLVELYYRYRINKQLELSPDFQYITTPGGNTMVAAIRMLGLRFQMTY